MTADWHHQLRLYLPEGTAPEALPPLAAILAAHDAALVSQLAAFEAYVAEAEREGAEDAPLYRWTKAVLADPEKRRKHAAAFAIRIGGQEVYGKAAADALEAALRPLVEAGAIARLSRHDTNPANNLPVPAEYRA